MLLLLLLLLLIIKIVGSKRKIWLRRWTHLIRHTCSVFMSFPFWSQEGKEETTTSSSVLLCFRTVDALALSCTRIWLYSILKWSVHSEQQINFGTSVLPGVVDTNDEIGKDAPALLQKGSFNSWVGAFPSDDLHDNKKSVPNIIWFQPHGHNLPFFGKWFYFLLVDSPMWEER